MTFCSFVPGGTGDDGADPASDATRDAEPVAADGLPERRHRRNLLQPGAVDHSTTAATGRHWHHDAVRTHQAVAG